MTHKVETRNTRIIRFSTLRIGMIWFLLTFLGACTMPLQNNDQPRSFSAQIVYPLDGQHVILGQTIDIETHVSSPGVVTSVILQVNGLTAREDMFSNPAFHSGTVYQPWVPPAPGTYELRSILKDSQGQASSNVVVVIVIVGTVSPPSLPETETPDPLTGTPTSTVTPDSPQVTADQNVNCRRGPSTAYPEIGVLLQGQTAPITGRNQDASWFYVNLSGTQCWVWGGVVTATGNVSGQPVIQPPPLPATDTPTVTPPPYTACHDYPDMATCNSDPQGFGGCSWDTGTNQCNP